jgi:hypothetical protein
MTDAVTSKYIDLFFWITLYVVEEMPPPNFTGLIMALKVLDLHLMLKTCYKVHHT